LLREAAYLGDLWREDDERKAETVVAKQLCLMQTTVLAHLAVASIVREPKDLVTEGLRCYELMRAFCLGDLGTESGPKVELSAADEGAQSEFESMKALYEELVGDA